LIRHGGNKFINSGNKSGNNFAGNRVTAKLVRQVKKMKKPVVLTVKGKAELVVQDESQQKLSEAKDRMEAIEGIKRGLESMKRGGGKPAEKFFKEFFAAECIPAHE